ncbi:MAG: hypothetical protein H7296_01225 [Bacteroidia bacterium]|nr:hypothetical protein [Bacteroidia bacterium]
MIDAFESLSAEEQKQLLKAPALVSVLAASYDYEITKAEKAEAFRFTHLKSYQAHPTHLFYFLKVEDSFEKNFRETVEKYAPFDDDKRHALKAELNLTNSIIEKLEDSLAKAIHKSLLEYTDHIRKADRSFLEYFVFPLPIPGLTD